MAEATPTPANLLDLAHSLYQQAKAVGFDCPAGRRFLKEAADCIIVAREMEREAGEPSADDVERFREAARGHGVALRGKDDPPIPGEPFMSMATAASIHAELAALSPRDVRRDALEEAAARVVARWKHVDESRMSPADCVAMNRRILELNEALSHQEPE